MNFNDAEFLSLKFLLGNDIYKLYNEKCEALKYQINIFFGDDLKNFKFPSLDDIIYKNWLKTFKNDNFIVKFKIYDNYEDEFDSIKKCYFLLGMIELKNLIFSENYLTFILYEKNLHQIKFLTEDEVVMMFGVKRND